MIKDVDLICEQCKEVYHVESKRALLITRYCSKRCFNLSRKGSNNPIHRVKDRKLVNKKISQGLLKSDKWHLTDKGRESLRNANLGKKASEETKAKCRINALNTLKKLHKSKVSNIEKIVEQLLIDNKIVYKAQKSLLNITRVDFYIPEKNTVIYCDGNYWHNLPSYIERDKRITSKLKEAGYKVLRFWEKDINATSGKCVIDSLINV